VHIHIENLFKVDKERVENYEETLGELKMGCESYIRNVLNCYWIVPIFKVHC
jgi:hypothetical protein